MIASIDLTTWPFCEFKEIDVEKQTQLSHFWLN